MTRAKTGQPPICVQRAYEDPAPHGGYRVLVDRIWPRGRSKESLELDAWARDIAPTAELRKWFAHDPGRWEIFQQRYRAELTDEAQQKRLQDLLVAADGRAITLIYGAKDEEHNQAIVLREVLSALRNE
jgi:uncharacterized protein YeaO (DUF488 family)